MNILVILAHPNRESFNHAIAKRVVAALKRQGHSAIFHDLYAEKFNPILSFEEMRKSTPIDSKIKIYCDELTGADGLVFVHPNWWGQPPAILKGWIDRVFKPGVAYAFKEGDGGEGVPTGLLAGKIALVFNTSDTPDKREVDFFGDPLDRTWKKCLFEFCGIGKYSRQMFNIITTSTFEQRHKWLDEVEAITGQYFP
ncbi:MAG: NAD(P)H-dependent oxidoreductase [Chitinispirillaceae bacterium]|jgi:putative NADPH-quinone reductase